MASTRLQNLLSHLGPHGRGALAACRETLREQRHGPESQALEQATSQPTAMLSQTLILGRQPHSLDAVAASATVAIDADARSHSEIRTEAQRAPRAAVYERLGDLRRAHLIALGYEGSHGVTEDCELLLHKCRNRRGDRRSDQGATGAGCGRGCAPSGRNPSKMIARYRCQSSGAGAERFSTM